METQKPKLWDIVQIINTGELGVIVSFNGDEVYKVNGEYGVSNSYAAASLTVLSSETLEELLQADMSVLGQTSFGNGMGDVSLAGGKIQLYQLKVSRQNARLARLAEAIELIEKEGYSVALK